MNAAAILFMLATMGGVVALTSFCVWAYLRRKKK